MPQLTKTQHERYKRNILLSDIGELGQRKLLQSRVLIIGIGGLGSPVALYLAAAGVGKIGLADDDSVDLSNLQRQIIHGVADLNRLKTASASEKITQLNPDVETAIYGAVHSEDKLRKMVNDYDFVVDATDNYAAKFLINDACIQVGKPFSHAGISQFFGQTMTIVPGESCCCRCVFGELSGVSSSEPVAEGLFGAIAGILGSIQAAEALKYLTGVEGILKNTLLSFDARTMEFRKVTLQRNRSCRICGDKVR